MRKPSCRRKRPPSDHTPRVTWKRRGAGILRTLAMRGKVWPATMAVVLLVLAVLALLQLHLSVSLVYVWATAGWLRADMLDKDVIRGALGIQR